MPDGASSTDFSLDAGSATGWDQFATHAKMTGGQSTYTEETYTTTIDRSAPDFRRREAEAARIAREIESSTSTNAHVREERGQAQENDYGDEEDKYSGVRRDFQPLPTGSANRYMPPALRAPSAAPSATGVPMDPAIISSQLARPGAPSKTTSQQSVQATVAGQGRTASLAQGTPVAVTKTKDLDLATMVGSSSTTKLPPRKMASPSPERSQNPALASQGVEKKVLGEFRQFADVERARVAEKKRMQTKQDRHAKINELRSFAKRFKLKTPIPEDLVGILAKDPKKQDDITSKAQRDYEEAKSGVPLPLPLHTNSQAPIPKFDKSQIPPPIPERSTFLASRGGKASVGRNGRPLGQQLPFGAAGVPLAPRAQGQKNVPAPIPMPELKSQHSTAGSSGVSSPRGMDTPTSAVSSKFNVRALEFRPTAPAFNPSSASVSAASPSPTKRTASIARPASPSQFFGKRLPIAPSERLSVTANFNPIERMKKEVKDKIADPSAEDKRDFAMNGGIPNAFHTPPTWTVAKENEDKTYENVFSSGAPSASPASSRQPSHNATPFQGQMPQMGGVQHIQQPHQAAHGQYPAQHHQPQFERSVSDMHMQNGSTAMFVSPNMTPRGRYASPMAPHVQYGTPQGYFAGINTPMMRPYGGNAAMMHGQHGMVAPMMAQQHSTGGYMNMPNQMNMVYPSPRVHHAYPQQQNGYPSPGPMAPVMMQQNSQQGYPAGQMMYPNPGMYGQPQMRGAYGGNTPYGSSPHTPHHLNQRAMSSGYQKGMPQVNMNNAGPPANAPQQPAAFGQMAGGEDAK